MLKIIGKVYISCTKNALDALVLSLAIPCHEIEQVGLKRRVPDVNSWLYTSPWYTFHEDHLDEEVSDFLNSCRNLKETLALLEMEINFANFILTPIEQNTEEAFSCLLSLNTLQTLVDIGLSLEIAPASVMPVALDWSSSLRTP